MTATIRTRTGTIRATLVVDDSHGTLEIEIDVGSLPEDWSISAARLAFASDIQEDNRDALVPTDIRERVAAGELEIDIPDHDYKSRPVLLGRVLGVVRRAS